MRIAISALGVNYRGAGVDRYLYNILKYMVDSDHEFVIFGDPDAVLPALANRRNVTVIRVHPRWQTSVGRVLWHLTAMLIEVKRRKLDVVWIPNNRLVLFKCSPVVMTIHDLAEFNVPGKYDIARMFYRKRLMRLAVKRADEVITDSRHSQGDLTRIMRIPPSKVHAIPLGVEGFASDDPASDAVLLKKYGVTAPYVLYVGRLEHPGKNIPACMDAVAAARLNTGIPLQFVVVGADSWRASAIYQHAAANDYTFVKFTGFVPDAEVGSFYRNASALLLLSLYEGFGLTPLEAMHTGTPVLASDRSSIPEVVGDCGVLVDPEAPADVARGLIEILSNRELVRDLTAKGRKRAATYRWDVTAQKTLQTILGTLRP